MEDDIYLEIPVLQYSGDWVLYVVLMIGSYSFTVYVLKKDYSAKPDFLIL